MSHVPPWLIVSGLLALIASQLFYALLPQRPRPYLSVLALTVVAWIAGQVWQAAGLPAARIGEANVLPALLFALGLQPAAPYLPINLLRRPPT
jgi:hypothetical protein